MDYPVHLHPSLEPLLVPADRLRPNPENPHDGDQDSVLDSLMVNGCYRPIYARRDGLILAGHTLYAALLETGADRVPVLWLDTDTMGARRILLGDNQIARGGVDDLTQVLTLLRALDAEDSLVGTGYTDTDIALMERHLAKLAQEPLEPETGRVRVLLEFTHEQARQWRPIEDRLRSSGTGLEAALLLALAVGAP